MKVSKGLAACMLVALSSTVFAQELLFFDMDKIVTKGDQGFPKGNDAPAENNCDWTSPIDYTKGTVYVRFEVRSAPTANCAEPSFAIWTSGAEAVAPPGGGRPKVSFTPDPNDISVNYGSFPASKWKEYGGRKTDWSKCRTRMGTVLKACSGGFLSPKNNWNWAGHNPDDIYPMDMRHTMVVVAPGHEFSGWATYIDSERDDETPPSKPSGLQAEAIGSDKIELTWNEAEDAESGISGYHVYRNGNTIARVKTNSFQDEGLLGNTTYSYEVSAINGDALEGPRSKKVEAKTGSDTTPPSIISLSAAGVDTRVTVRFSEALDKSSAEKVVNYTLDNGATISAASLSSDEQVVTLTTSPLSPDVTYTLTAENIQDNAARANTIAPNSSIQFTFLPSIPEKLNYAFFQGDWSSLPDFSSLTPVKEGMATSWDLQSVTSDAGGSGGNYGIRFTGMVEILEAGDYTFSTESDDGSALYIGDTKVVDNDGTHAMQEKSGTINLTSGMHPITVAFFQGGGGEGLKVSWEGTGIASKQSIPFNRLYAVGDGAATASTAPGIASTGAWPSLVSAGFTRDGVAIVHLDESRNYSIELYDIVGRVVTSKRVAARRRCLIPLDNSANGAYICVVRSRSTSRTIRLLH